MVQERHFLGAISTVLLIVVTALIGGGVAEWRTRQIAKEVIGPIKPEDVFAKASEVLAEVKSLPDNLPLVVVSANEDGVIRAVSSNAYQILKWDPRDLIGQEIDTIVPEEFRERHRKAFTRRVANTYSSSVSAIVDGYCIQGDGQLVPVQVSVSEIITKDGREFNARIQIQKQGR